MGVMVTKDEDDNQALTRRINADLKEKVERVQVADGEDPDTTDYAPSCSGDCSSCGGCH